MLFDVSPLLPPKKEFAFVSQKKLSSAKGNRAKEISLFTIGPRKKQTIKLSPFFLLKSKGNRENEVSL